MGEHSIRLIMRIDEEIQRYFLGEIDSRQLLNVFEGTCKALEEAPVKQQLEKLISEMNNSIYLYSEVEGKQYLRKEYDNFTNSIGVNSNKI